MVHYGILIHLDLRGTFSVRLNNKLWAVQRSTLGTSSKGQSENENQDWLGMFTLSHNKCGLRKAKKPLGLRERKKKKKGGGDVILDSKQTRAGNQTA